MAVTYGVIRVFLGRILGTCKGMVNDGGGERNVGE